MVFCRLSGCWAGSLLHRLRSQSSCLGWSYFWSSLIDIARGCCCSQIALLNRSQESLLCIHRQESMAGSADDIKTWLKFQVAEGIACFSNRLALALSKDVVRSPWTEHQTHNHFSELHPKKVGATLSGDPHSLRLASQCRLDNAARNQKT